MAKQRRLRRERAARERAERHDRMARVQVSDEVWAAFRVGLGPVPVNEALGELVRREVGRKARQSAADADGVRMALADARELAEELGSLIARLERADAEPPDGEPWPREEPRPWRDTVL